jgi:hypothetical protein
MDELAYGDQVLVVPRGGGGGLPAGATAYRPVYLFGHREAGSVQPYVSLTTASGHTLRLSPSHYIPVLPSPAAAPGAAQPKYASEVRPGDLVLVMAASGQATQLSAVVEAWQSAAVGAFNPFVRGADLVVDGVVSWWTVYVVAARTDASQATNGCWLAAGHLRLPFPAPAVPRLPCCFFIGHKHMATRQPDHPSPIQQSDEKVRLAAQR